VVVVAVAVARLLATLLAVTVAWAFAVVVVSH